MRVTDERRLRVRCLRERALAAVGCTWLGAALAFAACVEPAELEQQRREDTDGSGCPPETICSTRDAGAADASPLGPSAATMLDATSAPDGTLCPVGTVRPCVGAGGCPGTQLCVGLGVPGECVCPAAALRTNIVGARCTSNLDCGSDLTCWSPSSPITGIAGGPARGYCTRPCSSSSDCESACPTPSLVCPGAYAECFSLPEWSFGVSQQRPGLCFAKCVASRNSAVDEHKCHDRPDLACWPNGAIIDIPLRASGPDLGLCLPQCAGDSDCPGGYCTPGVHASLCSDQPAPPGRAIGDACATDEDCGVGRLCRESNEGTGARYCTQTCTLAVSGCGAALGANAACLSPYYWSPSTFTYEEGDIGLCAESCSLDSDCRQPGFTCRQTPTQYYHSSGVCESLPPAPDAGVNGG